MAEIIKKNFSAPDEVRNPKPEMKIEVVELDGLKLQKNTGAPGYEGHNCDIHHFWYVISGKVNVRMPGGEEVEFGPGDVGNIPPGHDARNTGSEPVIWLEIPH